jgi:hypothetical protein
MVYSPDPFVLPGTPPLVSDTAMYSTATSANASPNWPLPMQHQPQQMLPNTYQLPSPAVSLSHQPCWEQKPSQLELQEFARQMQAEADEEAEKIMAEYRQQKDTRAQHIQPQALLIRTPQPLPKPAQQPTAAPAFATQQAHIDLIDLTADDDDDEDAADYDVAISIENDDAAGEDEDEGADDEVVDRSDVVLVGLGLYDPPQRAFGAPGGLRLITESWQPPAEGAEDDDEEEES